MKRLSVTMCMLTCIGTSILTAYETSESYIALRYIVRVSDAISGFPGNVIRPRYMWLDDHRLVIPVKEVIEERQGYELQNISVFVIDLHRGTAVRTVTFESVYGVVFVPSASGDNLFVSSIYDLRPPDEGQFGIQELRERYSMDTNTLELGSTTREMIIQERPEISPFSERPYPDALISGASELHDWYRAHTTPLYDWAWWGDYIVGLGAETRSIPFFYHDLRLYTQDGATAYVLPEIEVDVIGLHSQVALQTSPNSEYLMISESIAGLASIRLYGTSPSSILYIYGFVDEDPTGGYETIIYNTDTEDFGAGYAIREVFEVEREIVDGSALSTGPVVER